MKFLKIIVLVVVLSSCSSTPKKNGIVKYNIPAHKVVSLANGLEVLMIQDKKLPLIQLSLLVSAGSTKDPENKQGLAYVTANLLKMGSLQRSASEISESFEQKGSSFGVTVAKDYIMADASALSKYKGELFNDFIEVITQPKFSSSEVSRLKKKLVAQNLKTLDNASAMASLALNKILFKNNHPYGKKTSGTAKSVRSLRQIDIRSFYKNHYNPKGSILAVIGDFDHEEIQPYLTRLSKNWVSKSQPSKVAFPELKHEKQMLHLVHKPESKQSQIRFGHMGISRDNKDFITLRVANAILGQGFSSRLLTEVRVKKGLTYTVGSSFSARKNKGPFLINTFTRHDKVNETITTVLKTIETYLKSGVTDSELEVAKSYLIGTFPRSLETSSSVAMNIMLLKYLGVSLDYLEKLYGPRSVKSLRKILPG